MTADQTKDTFLKDLAMRESSGKWDVINSRGYARTLAVRSYCT